jgi:hypothetical protein
MNHNDKQQSCAGNTLRNDPTYGSAPPQHSPARADRIDRFVTTGESSQGVIKYCKRSYRVGDLLRGLSTAWNPNGLVLITRSSGHCSYFYGINCLTGDEHLFNLQHYVGVDEV